MLTSAWRRGRACAGLAVALLAFAAPVHAQRTDLEQIIQRRVLANGLEVIVIEHHGVPLATVEVDVKNGAFTQSPEYEGLAHMYEHMFFKANAIFPEPEHFVYRASELGAVFNGTTSEERVNYFLTLPADSLEGGVHFIASALRFPLFRQDELEREREVVLGEYDRDESSPYFELTRAMDEKLWPGQTSRKNSLGNRQIIMTTTREKMQEIQRRYYIPNNSALIVAGDVKPDEVFALAEKYLGDWARGPDPFVTYPIPPIPPLATNEGVIVEQPVSSVVVLLEWQGPSVGADPASTYAADVFSDLVNDPGSTFNQRLVDSGLFQSIGINYYTLDHVGPISITAQTSADRLRPALAALEQEIARFSDTTYFTAEEVEAAKAKRTVSSAFERERASEFSHTVGFWWSVAGLEYYMGYLDNMARETRADLSAYARRYIVGKPRVTGVLLSPADRRALGLTVDELTTPGSTR